MFTATLICGLCKAEMVVDVVVPSHVGRSHMYPREGHDTAFYRCPRCRLLLKVMEIQA